MQIQIEPVKVVDLEHQVSLLIPSADHSRLVAVAEAGNITVISGTGLNSYSLGRNIETIGPSIDCAAKRFAYVESGGLDLVIRDLESGHETMISDSSNFQACYFDEKGNLWTVRSDNRRFFIEFRLPDSFEVVASAQFGNRYFAQGGAIMTSGGMAHRVFVNAYSGQSESENYLAEFLDGRIEVRHLQGMGGEQFPIAAPHGGEVITLDHGEPGLHRFTAPFERPTVSEAWPQIDEQNDEGRPGYFGCYLDLVNAVVASQEGRLFLWHTRSMRVTGELIVSGFEPVPAKVKYPQLGDDNSPVSDLITFERCNQFLYLVFARNYRSPSPVMAVIPIESFINKP